MTRCVKGIIAYTLFFTGSMVFASVLAAQTAQQQPASSQPSEQQTVGTQAQKSATPANVNSLKQQIASQQKEIEELRSALEKQQEMLKRLASPDSASAGSSQPAATSPKSSPRVSDETQQVPATSGSPNGTAPTQTSSSQPAATSPKSSPQVSDETQQVPTSSGSPNGAAPAQTGSGPEVASAAPPSDVNGPVSQPSGGQGMGQNPAIPYSPTTPIPLNIGGATLTPLGFVDATEFFRTENLGSGIGSSFGSIPFSNTVAGRLTEDRFTIQNSRIGLEMTDQFGENKVIGYLETDFLGAQPTNAFVTSNSDSLRIRLYWVDVTRGKFEFLAGQSWSLLTPGRDGISPLPADIFYSQDMDTNYQVGLTWSRQLQFRFVYHASPSVTAAVSLEDPDQYVGSAVVLPSTFSSSEVDTTASTSTPNVFPDVIGKIAFDPKVNGKDMHFEFAGLLSVFKTYSTVLGTSSTVEGGGGSFNFNLDLFKNFHLVESSFYSSGGGRYIYGLGPDFIVRPDGTPSLVQADSAIGGFEYQATPKTMFYGYYGGAYFGRDYGFTPPSTYVGYGYPASSSESSSQNKTIQEGTFGIIQTFWKNPRYGALQLITQYSYMTRAPWFVAPGSPKNAHLSEAYADIRYILP